MRITHRHLHGLYFGLLVLVLFVYGCSSGGQPSTNYRTGSQGLDMRWHPSNPSTFYDDERASVLLELRNRGTHDIESGKLFYGGFDEAQMSFFLKEGEYFSLEGKDEFDPSGDTPTYVTFETDRPIRLPTNKEQSTQHLQVRACYDYVSYATAEVCIDPDPYNRRLERKVCSLGASNYGAQGHPVVITSITPRVSDRDFRVEIQFSNSGSGIAFDPYVSLDACGQGLEVSETDKVHVRRVSLGEYRGDCTPQNPVRMLNGVGRITCEWPDLLVDETTARNSILEMELAYGYQQTIQTQFTLRAS